MKRNFEGLKTYAVSRLSQDLPGDLSYHSLEHTLDVLDSAIRIGKSEGISANEMALLCAAVMLHDIGFVIGYANHEVLGCDLAREVLPNFGYSVEEVEVICGLIMATRVPQKPEDSLQEIICDADLDYLGRGDFYEIGNRLYLELASRGIVQNEKGWNCLQIRFLSNHKYFTQTNLKQRELLKVKHLDELKALGLDCT